MRVKTTSESDIGQPPGFEPSFADVWAWENLLEAYRKAARGKRGKPAVAAFELRLADHLLGLQAELRERSYTPGGYRHFFVHEPKRRKISAAPFRDRVVHHALVNIIEPVFERRFIGDSYANRTGKGSHRAIDRLQQLARRHPFALRLDIVRHFPSIDHALLRRILAGRIRDEGILWLAGRILDSGAGLLADQYDMAWFPGDDLWAADRPRGLPIGNLTSQLWSNLMLDPLDHFVKRELRCPAYLRYVDDLALLADDKQQLWRWKTAIENRVAALRLKLHSGSAEVASTADGIPWLGWVVYPTHRRLKGRCVRRFGRRLESRRAAFADGCITFAELDASVQGWVAHAAHGDTWRLRSAILSEPLARPAKSV